MVVKVSGKKMLGEKITAKLNKSKIKDYDIEDENFQISSKNNESNDDSDNDEKNELEELSKREHYVKVSKSKIRDTTINLGEKYVGAKVGRDQLFENIVENRETSEAIENSDISDSDNDNNNYNDIVFDKSSIGNSDSDDVASEEKVSSSEIENESELDEEEHESEIESESESESETELFKRNKLSKLLDSEKRQILNRLSTSAKSDALKGYTVLKQGSKYDSILDTRIKIQKAVISSNYLPVGKKMFLEFKSKKTSQVLESTEEKLYSLIDRLLRIRSNQLIKENLLKPETINFNPKKRKLSEYLEINKKINEAVEPVTKSVLMKWSNKIQSASGVGALNQGKFKVINQSVWNQVNNQLSDLERLIKKTKINRRGITPLGYDNFTQNKQISEDNDDSEEEDSESTNLTAGLSNIDKSLQSNPYIFDDDDFYRLLLNDMINKKLDQKQAHSSAVLMLSKNKMQKNYDRMATKGRKLKYTVQEPLQQFEIPRRKYYTWNDEQIDELFAGLFGTNFKMDESEEDDEETVTDERVEDLSKLRESAVKLFG